MSRKVVAIICALCVCGMVCWFLAWSLVPDFSISEYEFSVLGDSLRNLGGVAAVFVAGTAAWIAYRTNENRRKEANRSNFKDRMQWTVEHLSSTSHVEQVYALKLLEELSRDPELDPADSRLAQSIVKTYKEELKQETRQESSRKSWRFSRNRR
ncbi:hypothetical protein [Rothia nasimurium]|uniref:hypothetical protein n=1 Tax=Rothia nasimurium TaxID=85336 RepID=UPI001F217026|nr:hypothetical protein [Rothia nasimurium]